MDLDLVAKLHLPGTDELRCHREEGFFYIGGVLSTRLQERYPQRLCELLSYGCTHNLIAAVALVACIWIDERQEKKQLSPK